MKKHGLMAGALILTAAGVITRCMGFFYRIYMSRILGAEGMGLYQLIMPLYMLAWTMTASGFTTTVSRLSAKESAAHNPGDLRRYVAVSMAITGGFALCISLCLFLLAEPISCYILKDPRTTLPLRTLSAAFPFMSMGSCLRGYFNGTRQNAIPAFSQILEQAVRLLTVAFFLPVFSGNTLEMACFAAVCGIVMGELVSFFFVWRQYCREHKAFNSHPCITKKQAAAALLSSALPLSVGRVTGSLLSAAENILIPQRLTFTGLNSESALALYGKLTGMAMPLIQFPSALLVSISITLVPSISEAVSMGQNKRLEKTISKALLLSTVTGFGAAGLFAAYGEDLCFLLYGQADLGRLILWLSALCPFLYLQIILSGILNGLGLHKFLLFNNILSSLINLFAIWFFVPIYGITAFLIGWLASLFVVNALSLTTVKQRTGCSLSLKNYTAKPLFAIVLSEIFSAATNRFLPNNTWGFLPAAAIMLCLYVTVLFFSGSLQPFSKK